MIKKDYLISIIVPTKDRHQYLCRAIKSIIDQTYTNWECLIIDDNSEIPVIENLNNLIKGDERFILIRNSYPHFASQSRNLGIKKAKGKFIAFLDDDDYWDKDKLKLQVNYMVEKNYKVSYCWSTLIEPENKFSFREPEIYGNIFDLMLDGQPLCNCSTFMASKSALKNVRCFNKFLKRGNDGDLIRKLSERYQIGVLKKRLVFYQVNTEGTNISTNNVIGIKRSLKSYKYRLYFFKKDLINRPIQYANINLEIARCYAKLNIFDMSLKYFIKSLKSYVLLLKRIIFKVIRIFCLILLIPLIYLKNKIFNL